MCLLFCLEILWSNSYVKTNEIQIITPDEGSVIISNLQTGRAKAENTSLK